MNGHLPVCFSALFNVVPSKIDAGLRPRPFSAYSFMLSVEPGVKLSIKNDGVGADELATNVSSPSTSRMNNGV